MGKYTEVVRGGPQKGTKIVTGGATTVRAGKQMDATKRKGSSK